MPVEKGIISGPPEKGIVEKGVLPRTRMLYEADYRGHANSDGTVTFDMIHVTDHVLLGRLAETILALPEKFTAYRPHQIDAIQQIMAAYDDGADVVILDAPTGTGKTIIAETVRRLLGDPAVYICSDKQLQHQFAGDFPYARVLKGRSNYDTLSTPARIASCDDCDKRGQGEDAHCSYCGDRTYDCPYNVAKSEALSSPLAVLNTAYFMTEANFVESMSGREFGIADECDTLEESLMGFVEFHVSERAMKDLGLTPPKKGIHRQTMIDWLNTELLPAIERAITKLDGARHMDELEKRRKIRRWMRLQQQAELTAGEYDDSWVRLYEQMYHRGEWVDKPELKLKPVKVSKWGRDTLWRHCGRWLIMSATVVSAEEMIDSLGLDYVEDADVDEPLDVRVVSVPMTFPAENRPIFYAPVANLTRKLEEAETPKLLEHIGILTDARPVRTLIHAHKYALANKIVPYLEAHYGRDRQVITYKHASEKELALRRLEESADGILVSVSMGRGVDLPGDACRLGIICKVPFPYLGDNQVKERLKMPGGEEWYATLTARVILQACGRPVRSITDHAETWILDRAFADFYKRWRAMFPEWWQDAYQFVRVREFQEYVRQWELS